MATYNLDQTHLQTVLTQGVDALTQQAVEWVLGQSGLAPTGTTLPGVEDPTSGPTTIGSSTLFVYEGPAGSTANVTSGGHNVIATGFQGANIIDTGPGGDTLVAGNGSPLSMQVTAGNNLLFGGLGLATLTGGSGNDTMWGGGRTDMVAGSGNDILHGGQYAFSADTLTGGSGSDILGVEQGNNLLQAGSGPTTMYGGSGADTLLGGSGADVMYSGAGPNTLTGGSGNDTMWGSGQSSLVGGSGQDIMHGGQYASSHDTLVGGSGNDVMGATKGNNTFVVGSGNTTIWAGAGADTVTAGLTGSATIYGGGSTIVNEAHSATDVASDTTVGGMREITFSNGQHLDATTNTTIHFTTPPTA